MPSAESFTECSSSRTVKDRRREHVVNGPSDVEAIIESPSVDPEVGSPVGNGLRYSVEGNLSCSSSVSKLVGTGCPSAVVRRVTLVVIDALKRVFGWARSHIGVERLKRVSPAVAHRDTSAAVVCERGSLRAIASAASHHPTVVFRRAASAVFKVCCREKFSFETSARFDLALTECLKGCFDVFVSAGAGANEPSGLLVCGLFFSDHGKSSYDRSSRDENNSWSHGFIVTVSHSGRNHNAVI